MQPILLTSLILPITLALTLALPALNHNRRESPTISGADTSISITLYPQPSCKGPSIQTLELHYDQRVAQQFKSYSLSHDLDDQFITIYQDKDWKANAPSHYSALDAGDPDLSCVMKVFDLEADNTRKGCHTLDLWAGCLIATAG